MQVKEETDFNILAHYKIIENDVQTSTYEEIKCETPNHDIIEQPNKNAGFEDVESDIEEVSTH